MTALRLVPGWVILFLAVICIEAQADSFRVLAPELPTLELDVPLPDTTGLELPARVGIGKDGAFKQYTRIDRGCSLKVCGPGTLRFFVRAHVPPDDSPPDTVVVSLSGLSGFPEQSWTVRVSPSRTSQYEGGLPGTPTGGKKITLAIPGGLHEITVVGQSNTGGVVYGIFYYNGPPMPEPTTSTEKPQPSTRWRIGSNFTLGVVYDDNICRYSDDTLELFQSNQRSEKFAITNREDVIFNSKFQVEFYRPLIFGKKTALRFRYQRWDYEENHIKANGEYNVRLRQTVRRYDYLEASYTYAPDSYIKELSDRPPFTPRSVPRAYLHFEITRNAFVLGYRYRANRWLSMKLFGGRTLRFYNRPFLENDLWEWNGRIETDLKYGRFTTGLRYAYADVKARGYDSVGETLENSDNDGDGSYEKDTYRMRITYRPKKRPYRPRADGSAFLQQVTGLFMTLGSWIDRGLVEIKTASIYAQYKHDRQFYTSKKPLDVDPLHVGRLDKSHQIQALWASQAVWNGIKLETAIRYTVRTADSPGGLVGEDPSEEKDYTGTRCWISASRPLW